ncbi:MAG: ABC transporter ATP-binding protein, partial [Clostridia bacterium]|nr:ABC transporter ATP-binding protein [Clostridia bacterium]
MKNTTVIKRLFKGQSRVVATLGVSLGFSLIQVVGSLMIPVLAGQAIDAITEEGVDFAALRTPLSGIVLCAVSAGIFGWIASALHNRAAYETVRNLRECAFSRLQQMHAATLDAHPHGDIVSRVINDAEQLADGLILGFSQLFTGVLTAVITLVFMVKISLVVALAVVVLTPLSLFTAKFIAGKTYRLFRRQSETRGRQTALIGEMIGHQKTLRVLGYEDRAVCRFEEVNEQLRRDSVKAVFSSSLTNPVTRFINNIIYAVVGLMGAWLALNGRITVGAFVSFLAYATQYTKPFNEISGVMTELQNAFACADRVLELIDQPIETEDPAAPPFPDRVGEMRMEKVSFSYEPGNPVLRNFSFTAKAGQKIAIVGPTGCGKTTLIHLLMRFYEPTSGRLLADGEDLRLFTKESLRRHFGMVLQETWVMNGTVR